MSRSETYTLPHDMQMFEAVAEMVNQGLITFNEAESIRSSTGYSPNCQLYKDSTVTAQCDDDYRPANKKEIEMRQDRAIEALTKQYATSDDQAWDWMRKGHEMGFVWGNHVFGGGGPTASDPLGQRTKPKGIALAFYNGSVYVGITIVKGSIHWAWFREGEWGNKGRELVLAGNRNYFPDPLSAIADYTLRGIPKEPKPASTTTVDDDDVNSIFGGDWDA